MTATDNESGGAPLVSVIIPTWNRAPMLRLTLQTVLAQDLPDFEVLVIGDGCTDDTEAVVASFADPRLRWHNLPVNSGAPSIPNNTGLRMARAPYIAHLGHDDFWLPWHLSGLLTTIESSAVDWVYSLVVAIGPTGIRHCTGPPQPGVPDAEHHVPPSGWLYRKEVAAKAGDWADPATLPWPIDFDYMRRAALAGTRFACHTRPTALKFPSSLFPDGYRSGNPAPIQQLYFDQLENDPRALEQEILRDLAARFAQLDRGGGKGLFNRNQQRSDTAPSDPVALANERAREKFQARRLGRLHLRGLAPASPPDETSRTATTDSGEHPEPDGIRDRFAVRQTRRERREQRAQRLQRKADSKAGHGAGNAHPDPD